MIVIKPQCFLSLVAFVIVGLSISHSLLTSIQQHILSIHRLEQAHKVVANVSSSAPVNDEPGNILEELKQLVYVRENDLNCTPPLVTFMDRWVDPSQGQQQKIPKILHISMRSRCVGRDLHAIINRWMQAFPNYSIIFHDDSAVDRLLHRDWPEFPNLHLIFPCLLSGAMKSDLWRVLVLYKFGGLYTDADNSPLSLNESHIEPTVSAFFLTDIMSRPLQSLMAMQTKHPIAEFTVHTIIENVLNVKNIATQRVVFVTGPHPLKKGYELFLHNQPDIYRFKVKDPLFVGMHNWTVRKLNQNMEQYYKTKLGWKDVVPYNATHNVTRRERWDLDNGVTHWVKARKENLDKKPHISCKEYLVQLNKHNNEQEQGAAATKSS